MTEEIVDASLSLTEFLVCVLVPVHHTPLGNDTSGSSRDGPLVSQLIHSLPYKHVVQLT